MSVPEPRRLGGRGVLSAARSILDFTEKVKFGK